ncbi:hypothetical protein A4X03_0g8537 [Tilletia caries]|uniref:Uncharacterized protein n=1 Tax=Tilletia caries TaxID=13290 RepID=A0A8T8SHF7_9BASI|nr:hypothetical protein A4X03_0g8537 [Tilletia caries]
MSGEIAERDNEAESHCGAYGTYTAEDYLDDEDVLLMHDAADELAALGRRVEALLIANREAVELLDEINKRATSRKFWGISQTIHAKLCTIRITLARATLAHPKQGTSS